MPFGRSASSSQKSQSETTLSLIHICAFEIFLVRVAAEKDELAVRVQFPHGARQFQTVHAGHFYIADDNVRPVQTCHLQRLGAVFGLVHPAVSYTHLDVYKRQNLACESVICNEAPDDDALAACRELGASLA